MFCRIAKRVLVERINQHHVEHVIELIEAESQFRIAKPL
jgi:hypothetical protein